MLTRRQLIAGAGTAAAGWQLSRVRRCARRGRAAHPADRVPAAERGRAPHVLAQPRQPGGDEPGDRAAGALPEPAHLRARHQRDGSINHMAVRSIFTGAAIADYLSPDPTVKSVDQVMADHVAGDRADDDALAAPGGHPRRLDRALSAVRALDLLLRAPAGRLRGQPGLGVRSHLQGRGRAARPDRRPAPRRRGAAARAAAGQLRERRARHRGGRAGRSRQAGGRLARASWPSWSSTGRRCARLRPAPVAGGSAPSPMDPPPDAAAGGHAAAGAARRPAMRGALASVEKLRAALQGKDREAYKHQYYSDIFDAQIDILARAVVCGLTRVATIQAGSADGNVTDPVGPRLPAPQHLARQPGHLRPVPAVVHDQVLPPAARRWTCPTRSTPGKTVLHNSLVLLMSECMPVGHESNSVPVILAGRRGRRAQVGQLRGPQVAPPTRR